MTVQDVIFDQNRDGVFQWRGANAELDTGAVRRDACERSPKTEALASRSATINGSRMKRTLDVVGATLGILLLAPLFIMVAALIKLDSRGPVLFRQQRYGCGRKPFDILKFRSMNVMESSGGFRQARDNDARVTRVGRVIRRTSIDELPQLINVLKGEMSLVGPRPHALVMDDVYGATIPDYVDRHLVKPGLTGLAQIRGFRGPTTDAELIVGRLRCDRDYILTWSSFADVSILAQTPFRLLDDRAF